MKQNLFLECQDTDMGPEALPKDLLNVIRNIRARLLLVPAGAFLGHTCLLSQLPALQ